MDSTPSGGLLLGRTVKHHEIERIASTALAAANRPAWGNPLVVALELGFQMLPCAPVTPGSPAAAPEWFRTTTATIVFAAEPDEAAHADRVRLALARGLLLRANLTHTPADMFHLARRLRQIPE